jgi:hypothetical protein
MFSNYQLVRIKSKHPNDIIEQTLAVDEANALNIFAERLGRLEFCQVDEGEFRLERMVASFGHSEKTWEVRKAQSPDEAAVPKSPKGYDGSTV